MDHLLTTKMRNGKYRGGRLREKTADTIASCRPAIHSDFVSDQSGRSVSCANLAELRTTTNVQEVWRHMTPHHDDNSFNSTCTE